MANIVGFSDYEQITKIKKKMSSSIEKAAKNGFLTRFVLCFSDHHYIKDDNKKNGTGTTSLMYIRMYQISENHPIPTLLSKLL